MVKRGVSTLKGLIRIYTGSWSSMYSGNPLLPIKKSAFFDLYYNVSVQHLKIFPRTDSKGTGRSSSRRRRPSKTSSTPPSIAGQQPSRRTRMLTLLETGLSAEETGQRACLMASRTLETERWRVARVTMSWSECWTRTSLGTIPC